MKKDDKITLIGNNDEKIYISQKAAQHSDRIQNLCAIQKEYGDDAQEVFCEGIADNEILKNIVHLLEKRTNIDVSHINEEKEREIEEQTKLHHLVDRVLRSKNYDLDLVKKYLIVADYLGVPFLNNVLTNLFVWAHDKNTVQKVIQGKKLPKNVLKSLSSTLKKHSENNKSIADCLKKDPEKHGKGFFLLASINILQGIELLPEDTESLDLGNNEIAQNSYGLLFPPQPFKQFSFLRRLSLRLNNLQVLTAGMFQGLDNLKKLNLGFNNIKSIQNGTFSCLKKLKKLNLNYLDMSELNAEIFKDLDNVQELDLYDCKAKINNNTFKYLKNLEILNLYESGLKKITAGTFNGLSNLENLNLSCSYNLKSIDKGAFSCMPKLKLVDLKLNKLDEQSKKEIDDFCKKNNIEVKWE